MAPCSSNYYIPSHQREDIGPLQIQHAAAPLYGGSSAVLVLCEGDTRNRWRDGQVCPDVDKELWRLGPDGSGEDEETRERERRVGRERRTRRPGRENGRNEKRERRGRKRRTSRVRERERTEGEERTDGRSPGLE
ncbi:hypothetical protein TNCV_4021761 [Trichonephila clavipes]|nr:hypothetical protein TNCV_4021761 [Trichonephila clavipes]